MNKSVVLIVDDEEGFRSQLKWALADDYNLLEASDGEQALTLAREFHPFLILQDIALSNRVGAVEGLSLIGDYLKINPFAKVIMVTGHGHKDNALEAIRLGAYDFFGKPVDLDQLRVMIARGLQVAFLEKENSALSAELARVKGFQNIVGDSDLMQEIFKIIKTVAPTTYTVLINGESGTGKELTARAIHDSSHRRDKPFVTINCGAIPENLLESELFGHEKGAFTDAHVRKHGKFELADGGTVFLDEIGELPLGLQVKLLRVMESRTIERVGGSEEIVLDVRLLAATNQDLMEAVRKGTFRQDLFYRLSVIMVELPPLRHRGDDVLLLADLFLRRYAEENGRPHLTFSDAALRALTAFDWPGNVRELENRIKRAVLFCQDKKIKPKDLSLPAMTADGRRATLQEVREEAERSYLLDALKRHKGNISRISRDIGVSRPTLYDLLEKYGLKE